MIDEILQHFVSERERSAVLDLDKRADTLQAINEKLHILKGFPIPTNINTTNTTSSKIIKQDEVVVEVDSGNQYNGTKVKSNNNSTNSLVNLVNADLYQNNTVNNNLSTITNLLQFSENDFYIKNKHSSSSITKPNIEEEEEIDDEEKTNSVIEVQEVGLDEKNCTSLDVVFDGTNRYACEFKVHIPIRSSQRPPALSKNTKWHLVNLGISYNIIYQL